MDNNQRLPYELLDKVIPYNLPSKLPTDTYLYKQIVAHYAGWQNAVRCKENRAAIARAEGRLILKARNHFKANKDFGKWCLTVFPHMKSRVTYGRRLDLVDPTRIKYKKPKPASKPPRPPN